MTYFDFAVPGLKFIVVAADGQNVQPVVVDEIRMAIGETYDVIVMPKDDKAYTIFAQSIDRAGYARGTLAPREGMSGTVPPMRPRALLTMSDMGMGSMEGMGHDMSGMDMSGMGDMGGYGGMEDFGDYGQYAMNRKRRGRKSRRRGRGLRGGPAGGCVAAWHRPATSPPGRRCGHSSRLYNGGPGRS